MSMRVRIVFLVILIGVVCSATAFAEGMSSPHFIADKETWDIYHSAELNKVTQEEVLAYAEDCYTKICTYLNLTTDRTFKIKFMAAKERSNASDYNNTMNIALSKARWKDTLFHELIHLFLPHANLTLAEGMATYVGYKITSDPRLDPMNSYLQADLSGEKIDFYKSLVKGTYSRSGMTLEEDSYIYICGTSFVMYMVEKYGFESFLEYYNGQGYLKSYTDVFGLSEDELLNNWIEHLKVTKTAPADSVMSKHLVVDKKSWNAYAPIKLTNITLDQYLFVAENCYTALTTYLKMPTNHTFYIRFLEPNARSQAKSYKNLMYVALSENWRMSTLHEMTHLLLPNANQTIGEGMAMYVGYKVTEFEQFKQMDEFLRRDLSSDRVTLYKVLALGAYDRNGLTQEEDDYVYICGTSFINYLAENFGFDKCLAFCKGEGYLTTYQGIFEKTEEELINNWIEYLKSGVNQ